MPDNTPEQSDKDLRRRARAQIEREQAARDDAQCGRDALALLRELEWSGYQGVPACPSCESIQHHQAHYPNCRLARLIGAKMEP